MNECVFPPPLLYRPIASCLYSSVLSLLEKPVNVTVRSRTVSGSEFQIEGPEEAKLRDPYCASRLRVIVRL